MTPRPSRAPIGAVRPVPSLSTPWATRREGARLAPSACRGGVLPRLLGVCQWGSHRLCHRRVECSGVRKRHSRHGIFRVTRRGVNGSASGSRSSPSRSSRASTRSWSRSSRVTSARSAATACWGPRIRVNLPALAMSRLGGRRPERGRSPRLAADPAARGTVRGHLRRRLNDPARLAR